MVVDLRICPGALLSMLAKPTVEPMTLLMITVGVVIKSTRPPIVCVDEEAAPSRATCSRVVNMMSACGINLKAKLNVIMKDIAVAREMVGGMSSPLTILISKRTT